MRTIAIIGGGFSGTMTAVNLARFSEEPLKIIMINTKRPFGRGTAYGTARREHLLNVAARNMSAFPDFPNHFVDWLRTRSDFDHVSDQELREMFIPRAIYGDYIRLIAEMHLRPVHSRFQLQFELIEDEATDIELENTESVRIVLNNQGSISANAVLLATGNQPPAALPSASPLAFDLRYCADPWDTSFFERLPPHGSEIVILGTGLTMVDVIVTMDAIGWRGKVTAISRNGMLPQSHFRGIAYPDYLPVGMDALHLDKLVQVVEENCQRLVRMSQNPAIAIDKLRPHTQRLWQGLSIEDKKDFLSKYGARWNVTRHRIAQSIHQKVTDRLDEGMLQVIPGTIESLVTTENSINVRYRDQLGNEGQLSGDFVVNCTGPQSRFSRSNSSLYRNLISNQIISLDDMDMGIRIDDDFAVLNDVEEPVGNLYAIGPPLKGTLWETTAVPELRGQAMRVAQIMLNQMPSLPEEEYLIEYCI
ncbi:FAD/NAD(P)-binding protein [uncultured Rubinisphaera sp.]|uniref:FAD/NAD(P)-binding protein n=1 Tax=uncultured Rubinisphaera sp. TaxID=1678686 RepID=UPI0030DC255C